MKTVFIYFFRERYIGRREMMNYRNVKELMTTPAITCEDSCSIKTTIETMATKNIGFIPITKGGIIVGVVTDRDILLRSFQKCTLDSKISEVMTEGEMHFVSPSTSLVDAAKIMAKNKIRRLVVLNDGKVSGVLTTKNLLKEPSLLPYIIDTYLENSTLSNYAIYENSNPHDSVKTADFPL
jgi:CBS domain-containing protein